MNNSSRLLSLWRKSSTQPGGKKIVSRLICTDAPYFASIKPTIAVLEPGHVEVCMARRRGVLDRDGNIHTAAMCTLAELAGRCLAEVTLPADVQWVSHGMTAQYLDQATTALTAVARMSLQGQPLGEHTVDVDVRDINSTLVCHARLLLHVSPVHGGKTQKQAPAARLHSRILNA